eukprot:TRINITY_DN41881_c0_g1_i1.p1 TRINITY_DN41881_c0_g1~~TRINITY_DN41881_c0_g1_i1.p1  ORF type:complete len:173 (+),score=22.92 TRINITY_DN41881_c0_g1_i1:117-635(+)
MEMSFGPQLDPLKSVVICHSEPGAWHPANYLTAPCPPQERYHTEKHREDLGVIIGRTMFETDRLPQGWTERLNKMDEVWVPTNFHRKIFEEGGVESSKLIVIPEPVDVDFYNPATTTPILYPGLSSTETDRPFVFLSIFKWEERKGWKFLIEEIGRAVQQECRDRSRMPSSA